MKNIDKIRQMTADELAELISGYISRQYCLIDKYKNMALCEELYRQWLEQESEE